MIHSVPSRPLALWVVAALLACTPQPPGLDPDPPPPSGIDVMGASSEFTSTHHGRLEGVVADREGQPLEEVEVTTLALADPSRGSLAQHRGVSDSAGRFTVPVGVILPSGTDTATLRIVVRGIARAPRHPRPSASPYYTADTVVAVRVVPRSRPAPTSRTALRVAIP
ncbi:MAG TPA: hypothetical protein VGR37_07000 [Longimicrobiaceae bacterium]|nr:hypothetical protein [Longimicrobiaceae bacterium]